MSTSNPLSPTLVAELARMTAYFQLRTIATQMGVDPDHVDPDKLTLRIEAEPTQVFV